MKLSGRVVSVALDKDRRLVTIQVEGAEYGWRELRVEGSQELGAEVDILISERVTVTR
jgi:hypothetical protein